VCSGFRIGSCATQCMVARRRPHQEPLARGTVFFTKRPWAVAKVKEHVPMLGWALTFLVIALIAAVLGFGGIAGLSIEIAKIIFFVAVVLFLISAIVGLMRGRRTIP